MLEITQFKLFFLFYKLFLAVSVKEMEKSRVLNPYLEYDNSDRLFMLSENSSILFYYKGNRLASELFSLKYKTDSNDPYEPLCLLCF